MDAGAAGLPAHGGGPGAAAGDGDRPASTTAEQGGEPVVVRFTLDKPAAAEIEVGYRLAGTADASDHAIAAPRIVIPAGKTAADLEIRAVDDTAVEANESCLVTLTPSAAYAGDGTDGDGGDHDPRRRQLLVDADLKVYYTFDKAELASGRIRNDAGPDRRSPCRPTCTRCRNSCRGRQAAARR